MSFCQIIRSFDRNPAYVSINYDGRKIHKSRTGGCISVIFLISVFFIFFFKIYSMLQQENVIFETRISKDDFNPVNLSDADIRLAIKDIDGNEISCQKFNQFNFQARFQWKQLYEIGGSKNGSEAMQPCSKAKNQTQFCIKNKNILNISGRTDVVNLPNEQKEDNLIINEQFTIKYRQFSIKLSEKQPFESIKNPQLTQIQVTPIIKFTNNVINQQKKDISQALFDKQQRIFKTSQPLTINANRNQAAQKKSIIEYTFQIKKVIFITDYSVLPTTIKKNLPIFKKNQFQEESWFYGEEFTTQTYTEQEKPELFVATFTRSMYTNTYVRHFAKLDTVLAEGFGLTGLLSMVLFCLYQGYNEWVLEKQNIGHQKQVNILHYYKHQIKNFCYFVTNIIAKLLKFFKLYNCLKWIQKKLCYCLYEQKQIQMRTQSFINRRRLEQELDIYRSKRQLNFLKKRVEVIYQALQLIGKKVPQIKLLVDKQIRLSEGYDMSQSLITSFKGKQSMQEQNKEDLLLS